MHVQILKIVSLKKIVVRLGIPAIDNLGSHHILCGLLSCWYFFLLFYLINLSQEILFQKLVLKFQNLPINKDF